MQKKKKKTIYETIYELILLRLTQEHSFRMRCMYENVLRIGAIERMKNKKNGQEGNHHESGPKI